MYKIYLIIAFFLIMTNCKTSSVDRPTISGEKEKNKSVGDLPPITELPDPFLTDKGTRITTKAQWAVHRQELKERIQFYMYGFVAPASPVKLISKSEEFVETKDKEEYKKAAYLLSTGPGDAISFTVNIFSPGKMEKPLPPIIVGDLGWESQLEALKPEGIKTILDKGYLVIEFDRTQFAADENHNRSGVYPLYPEYSWGALAAWAWGYHRTVDFIETLDLIDASKIIVTGFSRGGKAALLAGALDERIALVNPNCSGTAGAGPIRFIDEGAETINDLADVRFPYWFSSKFRDFMGDNRDRLPFDQHTLIGLVAPRAYYSTNGLQDIWANPKGTAQSHIAATEIYTAFGAEDKIGIYFANTGHDHQIDKWLALTDFADRAFYKQHPSTDFNSIPFPDLPKAYSWKAPRF